MLVGAVELGGSKVLCAVGHAAHGLSAETRIETRDPESTLAAIEAFFAPHRGQLGALGIASFGPLELNRADAHWGCLRKTPKSGWSDTSIAPRLSHALQVPVAIDTDVNAAALAEQIYGAARGAEHAVYITVGTGIGVGVVIGGKPLHGLMHPELGHIRAPDFCRYEGACPFHGRCLEGVASARALSLRTGESPATLADDDPVWELEARYLAHLVTTAILAYSPHRIVLGGGVLARPNLIERVRVEVVKALAGYVPRPELSEAGIAQFLVAPGLGHRAGLLGAFHLGSGVAP